MNNAIEIDNDKLKSEEIARLRELLQDLVKRTAKYRYSRTVLGTGSGEALSAYDAMHKAEHRATEYLQDLTKREEVRDGE